MRLVIAGLTLLLCSALWLPTQVPLATVATGPLLTGVRAWFDLGVPRPGQPGVAAGGGVVEVAAIEASSEVPMPNAVEGTLLDLVNADRVNQGLAPLEYDPDLLWVARARAAAQIPLPKLSHWDDSGQLVFVGLLAEGGLSYRLAGENLARLSGPDATAAERANQALLNSPSHRANILEPTFDHLAVGSAVDGSGRVIFAQIFRASPQW